MLTALQLHKEETAASAVSAGLEDQLTNSNNNINSTMLTDVININTVEDKELKKEEKSAPKDKESHEEKASEHKKEEHAVS